MVAEVLAAAQAIAASPARPGEPRDADRIARRDALAPRPVTVRPTTWCPSTSGSFGLRKLAVDDVQVGPADPAGGDGHDDLARCWLGIVDSRLAQERAGRVEPPSHARLASFHADRGRGGRGTERARENFPVASLFFPRELRPHLRAIYGYARLVDMLGDEWAGDRLAALDELEAEVDRCYGGEPVGL